MREEYAVINWRALTALNVEGFVQGRPGVFILAHQSPHDMNRVKPPYFFGSAADVQQALAAHVKPTDPAQQKEALKGNRWFRVFYGDTGGLDEQLATIKERWAELAAQYEAHGGHSHSGAGDITGDHGGGTSELGREHSDSVGLEHRGDDAGQH
jgi:hypothetical protein